MGVRRMVRKALMWGITGALAGSMIFVGTGAASAAKPEVQKSTHGHEFKSKDAKALLGFGRNPNLVNHGGPVLTTPALNSVKAIFWGNSWSNGAFAGDKVT